MTRTAPGRGHSPEGFWARLGVLPSVSTATAGCWFLLLWTVLTTWSFLFEGLPPPQRWSLCRSAVPAVSWSWILQLLSLIAQQRCVALSRLDLLRVRALLMHLPCSWHLCLLFGSGASLGLLPGLCVTTEVNDVAFFFFFKLHWNSQVGIVLNNDHHLYLELLFPLIFLLLLALGPGASFFKWFPSQSSLVPYVNLAEPSSVATTTSPSPGPHTFSVWVWTVIEDVAQIFVPGGSWASRKIQRCPRKFRGRAPLGWHMGYVSALVLPGPLPWDGIAHVSCAHLRPRNNDKIANFSWALCMCQAFTSFVYVLSYLIFTIPPWGTYDHIHVHCREGPWSTKRLNNLPEVLWLVNCWIGFSFRKLDFQIHPCILVRMSPFVAVLCALECRGGISPVFRHHIRSWWSQTWPFLAWRRNWAD